MQHTVLFVDDDASITDGVKRTLHREPYRVLTASSPAEALDRLAQEPIDVVVSDEQMPGMLGTEFLAEVRRRHPSVVRMMLTGHASLKAVVRAINEGRIYHIFLKPCNTVELSITIRHALRQKDLLEESRRLVRLVKRQAALVGGVERHHPGITDVRRDAAGAVLIDEPATDARSLSEQIDAQLGRCERLMGRPL